MSHEPLRPESGSPPSEQPRGRRLPSRGPTAAAPALALATVCHLWVGLVAPAPPTSAGPAAQPAPTSASPCAAALERVVDPRRVLLGEAVTVSLRVALDCPGAPIPLDVVLVIDRSPSMKGQALADARSAASTFLDRLDLGRHHVGVASFFDSATVDARLSGDRRYLRSAIQALETPQRGGTDITKGLRAGAHVLDDDRARPEAARVLVLLSDGQNNYGRPPVLQAAALLRDQGVHLVTMALGGAADAELLAAIASSPADALHAPFSRDLGAVFDVLAARLEAVAAQDLRLEDPLPETMSYLPRSARPAAVFDGSALSWALPLAPTEGLTLTWSLRPGRLGLRPLSDGGWLRFVDSAGRAGRVPLPPGEVEVLAEWPSATPTPRPSSTPVAASPTPSAAAPTSTPPAQGVATATIPSADRTATAGARARGTGTPGPGTGPGTRPSRRYLPLVGAGVCRQSEQALDLVVLIDASTTMRRPAADGRPRIEMAQEATRALADRLLGPEGDVRLGIVAFDEQPRTILGLTSQRASVHERLDRGIATATGSRIDRGIDHGLSLLAGPAGGDHAPARMLLLLSDGQVVGATDEAVRAAAEGGRRAGVELWSVALGPDARRDLLAAIAGGASRRLDVPDLSRLVERMLGWASGRTCP